MFPATMFKSANEQNYQIPTNYINSPAIFFYLICALTN